MGIYHCKNKWKYPFNPKDHREWVRRSGKNDNLTQRIAYLMYQAKVSCLSRNQSLCDPQAPTENFQQTLSATYDWVYTAARCTCIKTTTFKPRQRVSILDGWVIAILKMYMAKCIAKVMGLYTRKTMKTHLKWNVDLTIASAPTQMQTVCT